MYIPKKGDRLDLRQSEQELPKVQTLFKDLNKITEGGFQAQETIYVLAESGRGKSTLLDCMALDMAIRNEEKWVYIFYLEESVGDRKKRMMQAYHRKTAEAMRKSSPLEVPEMNLIMLDSTDFLCTLSGIKEKIDSMKDKYPPSIVIIDYLGELTGVIGQDHNAFTLAGRQMKNMAIEYNIPFATGHQAIVNDEFDYNENFLDERNISGAKAMIRNASIFMSINRTDADTSSNMATINVFKNRRGPKIDFKVYMDLSQYLISDI